jgi:hypothetical protein
MFAARSTFHIALFILLLCMLCIDATSCDETRQCPASVGHVSFTPYIPNVSQSVSCS